MNTSSNESNENQKAITPIQSESPKWVKIKLPMKAELYREINSKVTELSTQLGFKITLPNFLHKTITDHWKDQLEYYQKLEKGLKRTRL